MLFAALAASLLLASCGEKKESEQFTLPDPTPAAEQPTGISGKLTYKGFTYYINYDENYAAITDYEGEEEEVSVPSQVSGYAVRSLEAGVFDNCTAVKISIPSTIKQLSAASFGSCYYVEEFIVSDGSTDFKSVDGVLFNKNGDTLISYPSGKTDEKYVIPAEVKEVPVHAFYYASRLKSLEIGSGITSLPAEAVYGCQSLETVTLGKSLTDFEAESVYACMSLKEFVVNEANPSFKALSGVLYNSEGSRLVCYPMGMPGESFTVPAGVSEISDGAFEGNSELKSVSLPEEMSLIGRKAFAATKITNVSCSGKIETVRSYAFMKCEALTVFPFAEGLTAIEDGAFYGCSALTGLSLPKTVTKVGAYAFGDCSALTEIVMDEAVESIGDYAFMNCAAVGSVKMSPAVTGIGAHAFDGLAAVKSIEIPSSVTYIGDAAFANMSALTSLSVPDSVTEIGESLCYGDSALTEVKIGNGVENVEDNAFYGCSSLAKVSLGSKIKKIDDGAFYGCIALTDINIPDSVTLIRDYAFFDCTGLKSIRLSDNVKKICYAAFSGCTGLESINMPASVEKIKEYAFYECDALKEVVVPEGFDTANVRIDAGNEALTALVSGDEAGGNGTLEEPGVATPEEASGI